MKAIVEALAAKREEIAKLQRQVEALEAVLPLLGDEAPPVRKKPGPKPKEPERKKRLYSRAGDPNFACGHARSPENTTPQKGCRICKREKQRVWAAKRKAEKSAAAPAEEPAPVEPPKVVSMSEATAPAPKWPMRDDYKPPKPDKRFYAGRGWK